MTTTMLDAALAYSGRDWPVFPLRPRDKVPITAHGFKEASANPNMVERWWDRFPDANIGLATGAASKVWVLDVDGPEGEASLVKLMEELGELPDTLVGQTGGGGHHYYFAWPEGREVRNRANLRPGIDVRGEGGYVVLPPSTHPSGAPYVWVSDDREPIRHAPKSWLDFACPPKAPPKAPWERVDPSPRSSTTAPALMQGGKIPLLERAKLYLAQVDPAVQGQGGHNSLLWAARCLVVGFELPEEQALALLWSDYNPRCVPPWSWEDEGERADFERKVRQANTTPADKPRGWLLDEFGLRRQAGDEAALAIGASNAAALLASAQKRAETAPETIVPAEPEPAPPKDPGERRPFPLEHFPEAVRSFCYRVCESHNVDESFAGLPVLCVAGAAMGNAWRLELKRTFVVPPILWVALVAPHGQNKSGPLKSVMEPLRKALPMEAIGDPILNPQGRVVVTDATLEAVVARMQDSRRGILNFRDELRGWIKSFGQHKRGGGDADEAAWLEFWGGTHYSVDRKTNNEHIFIPAASASVLGGIQPSLLVKCFDPDRFASGFVSRVLIACPPRRSSFWNEHEIDPAAETLWDQATTWLRATPFVGMDTANAAFIPRTIALTGEPKTLYKTFYDSVTAEMEDGARDGSLDENAQGFLSKARLQAGRLALIHHGLRLACGSRQLNEPVTVESVKAGAEWARWCLEEQLRVYGYGSRKSRTEGVSYLLAQMRAKLPTLSATVRQVMRLNARRYDSQERAAAAMGQLVELGYARWEDDTRNKVILNEEAK